MTVPGTAWRRLAAAMDSRFPGNDGAPGMAGRRLAAATDSRFRGNNGAGDGQDHGYNGSGMAVRWLSQDAR